MSGAAVRFLFVAVAGWAVLRGATLGALPGAEAFPFAKADAAPPRLASTSFPPVEPVAAAPTAMQPDYPPYGPYQHYAGQPQPQTVPVPVYYYPAYAPARTVQVPLPPAQPQQAEPAAAEAPPEFYAPIPRLDEWQMAGISTPALPTWRGPSSAPAVIPVPHLPADRLDRLQLSAWTLLRGRSGTGALASGGTLGGSQAGARLTYQFDPRIAASLRSTSPVGGSRGGEVAAGVRLTPFPSIPFALTAERRQAIGRYSTGRSAFAVFVEGGVYQKPVGWNFSLDGHAQAGVVDFRDRDLFADGALAISRPVWGPISAGVGAWGGYQPGLYRVDVGPRVSYRVRPNISVHFDYRQRVAGTAFPASGPAVTLGANF